MMFSKPIILGALLTALFSASLCAKEVNTSDLTLDQAYLAQWFSHDLAEPGDLTLVNLEDDEFGARAEIRFTSDDGHAVNGVVAYPGKKASAKKFALALHPMGTDQQFWWSDKSPLAAQKMTARLRQQGYTVLSLDARLHGERGVEGFGPHELIKTARSEQPRLYLDTIIGTVRDYRIALSWAKRAYQPDEILVMGYSMGAQMSLLLASYEPSIDTVVAMVPPYVGSPTSPVAPRVHVKRISNAKVLWLAGKDDPYSNSTQTQETFDKITSADKNLRWFDSGHRLPPEFLNIALSFFDSINAEAK